MLGFALQQTEQIRDRCIGQLIMCSSFWNGHTKNEPVHPITYAQGEFKAASRFVGLWPAPHHQAWSLQLWQLWQHGTVAIYSNTLKCNLHWCSGNRKSRSLGPWTVHHMGLLDGTRFHPLEEGGRRAERQVIFRMPSNSVPTRANYKDAIFMALPSPICCENP